MWPAEWASASSRVSVGDDFWESSHRNAIVAFLSLLGLISFILRLLYMSLALQKYLKAGIKHTCNHIRALWRCQKGAKGLLASRWIWPTVFIHTVASAESQRLPHSQEKEGLVFIRGHQCYLVAAEHWGAECAEGGSQKAFWNARAGTC